MPRILNVQVPDNKRIAIGLSYIKGIGKARAKTICEKLNLSEQLKIFDLTKNQIASITNYIKKHYKIGAKIDNDHINRIRTLIRLSTYRGLRHFKGLPVRGQRTRTNSKTVRRVNRKF